MDKRRFRREPIEVPANFYIEGGEFGKIEFTGMIGNICEGGLSVEVLDAGCIEIAETVTPGTIIKFIGIDEYEIFKEERVEYIEGEAEVVRIESSEYRIELGCEIKTMSRRLENYILDKKTISFQRRGCVL